MIYINPVEKIIGNIAHLVSLIRFCLFGKKITRLSENFSVLSELTYLYLGQQAFNDFYPIFQSNAGKYLIYLFNFSITSIFTENNLIIINRLKNEPKLSFYNCKLESLPKSIGNLHNLTEFHSKGQRLITLPESIGNLSNLNLLDLVDNQLTSLPKSIGNLSSLNSLDLHDNRLVSLPDSIGNLSSLISLSLSNNRLVSLPDSIGNLSNLQSLCISNNQLKMLPDSLGNLSNLKELVLNYNQLTRLPNSISNLTQLGWIYISGNSITDLSILQNIPRLRYCKYRDVQLTNYRYFTKLSEWKEEWLNDEKDSAVRQVLLEQLQYNYQSSD
jgi:leucine-rich repeat protein SHOC2